MEKCILVTGFDPFGGERINPAWETVLRLPEEIKGHRIVKKQIPTVFGRGAEEALRAARECASELVVLLGQAGGRDAVTPEQVAVNLRRARIPDNAGQQPRDEEIIPGGPAAFFTALPALGLTETLAAEGYRVKLSYSAGTFVCNDVFYTLSAAFAGSGTAVEFVHVPYLPEQAGEGVPSMALEEMVRTVTRFLELAVKE